MSDWGTALERRIKERTAQVTVVGMGYVGLSLAVELARAGLAVRDIDLDLERVNRLNRGESYLVDVSSEALRPLLGRVTADLGILHCMTRALDAAIAKLAALPGDEQDRIAQWLLDELRDEEHWARQFSVSQDALAKLAAEARAERAAGRATELDPDEL